MRMLVAAFLVLVSLGWACANSAGYEESIQIFYYNQDDGVLRFQTQKGLVRMEVKCPGNVSSMVELALRNNAPFYITSNALEYFDSQSNPPIDIKSALMGKDLPTTPFTIHTQLLSWSLLRESAYVWSVHHGPGVGDSEEELIVSTSRGSFHIFMTLALDASNAHFFRDRPKGATVKIAGINFDNSRTADVEKNILAITKVAFYKK